MISPLVLFSQERLDVRFPYLEFGSGQKDDGLEETGVQRLNKMPTDQPRFIKTHLPLHFLGDRGGPQGVQSSSSNSSTSSSPSSSASSCCSSLSSTNDFKLVYVTRNPKDVVVSLYSFFVNGMQLVEGSFEDFARDFMKDKQVYSHMIWTPPLLPRKKFGNTFLSWIFQFLD